MSYKISNLRVKNFKCFDSKKFYKFTFDPDRNPSILSGPNGFGKTTFFDAIELIFTNNITRLQTAIERQNTNLKKNILVNEAEKDGLLILELINEKHETLTVIAVIDHKQKKMDFRSSIKYCTRYGNHIGDSEIISYIDSVTEWKFSAEKFEELKYSLSHFNVFYYVSQAESVHFLKNSISSRKDAMNVLLNTESIDSKKEYIQNQLIGGNISKKGVLVNDEISLLNESIDAKVSEIKLKMVNEDSKIASSEFQPLLVYPEGMKPLEWDVELKSKEDVTKLTINEVEKEIKSLVQYAKNKSDYQKKMLNKEIQGLIDNSKMIEYFVEYHKFIENDTIKIQKIIDSIDSWKQEILIYNHSKFFREKLNCDLYKETDLISLKKIDDKLIGFEISEVSRLVKNIKDLNGSLSSKQKILADLLESRKDLADKSITYDSELKNCPFCNQPYNSLVELQKSFDSLTEILENEENADSVKKQQIVDDLLKVVMEDQKVIIDRVKDVDDNKINELNRKIVQYQKFKDDVNQIKSIEKIYDLVKDQDTWINLDSKEKKNEIERLLLTQKQNYTNVNFEAIFNEYKLESTHKKYHKNFEIEQLRIVDDESVEQKLNYLKYVKLIENNVEINEMKAELKKDILKLKKVEACRKRLDKLKKIYEDSIDEYSNQILKKLRVPLLIYTGKILQDYQNGLGVFVSKDEMRFVSNGDAKHDILNTFSSGQLSGFVLAFLFSMNKQYIHSATDDIGFILIDDPVQTMDDINITSLIEVLRNDFSDKQIILSTHESDKENYILYKFLKYNQTGQSFNVQVELYT